MTSIAPWVGFLIVLLALLDLVQPLVIRRDEGDVPDDPTLPQVLTKTSEYDQKAFADIRAIGLDNEIQRNDLKPMKSAYYDGDFQPVLPLDQILRKNWRQPFLLASPVKPPKANTFDYILTESPARPKENESGYKTHYRDFLYYDMICRKTKGPIVLVNLVEAMTHIPDKPGEKKVFEKPERLNYGDKKYTGPGESGYTVTLLESNDKLLASQGIQQRTIEINCGKETRKAVYVGYDLWKNHAGAPVEHVTTILRLMADARRNNPETVSVINCAMGVGRSGTVAILDWLTRVVKQDSAWYFEPTDNSILKDEFLQNAFKENESIKKLATDDPILAMILYFRKYRRVIDAPAQIGTMRKYMYQLYMDC